MLSLELKNISPTQTETYNIIVNRQVVGMCQLRRKPTKSEDMPDNFESHIYYEISSEFRNKGYASEALRQILERAKDFGLEEVIITVANDNEASKKVILKNGGELVEKARAKDGKIYEKYKLRYNVAYGRR
jgi:predicted acetyltransferase